MCEEESEDTEAVEKLKQINDSIQRTIERYKLVKKGDFDGAARIPKGTLGTTTGVGKNANNELSLIDFDPEEPAPSNGQEQAAVSSLEDDLLGLSFGDRGAPGPVNLGFGMYHSLGCVCAVLRRMQMPLLQHLQTSRPSLLRGLAASRETTTFFLPFQDLNQLLSHPHRPLLYRKRQSQPLLHLSIHSPH
jgi:hypothetical protein